MLFGINDPTGSDSTPIDIDAIEAKLASPEYAAVTKSIEDAGFGRPDFNRLSVTPNMSMVKYPPGISLLATYAGQARDLKAWSEAEPRAQINDDMNLRLQYLAGMWLNSPANAATEILLGYQANDGVGILDTRYFRFPDERSPAHRITSRSSRKPCTNCSGRSIFNHRPRRQPRHRQCHRRPSRQRHRLPDPPPPRPCRRRREAGAAVGSVIGLRLFGSSLQAPLMTDVPSLPPNSVEPNIPLSVPPGPAQGCESFADPVLGLALLLFFGSGCVP